MRAREATVNRRLASVASVFVVLPLAADRTKPVTPVFGFDTHRSVPAKPSGAKVT